MNSFNVGGVTNVAMAIYNGLNKDEYLIDFIRRRCYEENELEKMVKANGSKVYYFNIPKISKIPFINYHLQHKKIVKEILSQIGDNKYDVIHIHAHACVGILLAKALKIPVRILHFHEAIPDFGDNVNKSFITKTIWKHRQKNYNKWATVKAGDSLKACKVKYGDSVTSDPKLCVLYPPIDVEKFNPNNYDKEKAIKEFSIDKDCFNLIHVGRLSPVKNQKFIIDILKEIISVKKAKLYFVGDGEIKNELINHAKNLGVLDSVIFLPPNTSPDIYLGMDCSILPSFSEAFGMVAVESQLMGVPCVCSTNVPNDVDVGVCEFLDLSRGAKFWAELIINAQKVKIEDEKKEIFSEKFLVKKVKELYDK